MASITETTNMKECNESHQMSSSCFISYDNKSYLFGYCVQDNSKKRILIPHWFRLSSYNSNIIVGQFLTTMWFQQYFDMNYDIHFYIIEYNSNIDLDVIRNKFIDMDTDRINEMYDDYKIYIFHFDKKLLQQHNLYYNSKKNNDNNNDTNNNTDFNKRITISNYVNGKKVSLSLHCRTMNTSQTHDSMKINKYLLISLPAFEICQ
jgi:hypothetical protein